MHINILEFIRTVLLHSSQVDDGKQLDFGQSLCVAELLL